MDSTQAKVSDPVSTAHAAAAEDAFQRLVRDLCASEDLRHVLATGDVVGSGEALAEALSRNPGAPRLFFIEPSPERIEALRAAHAGRAFVQCYPGCAIAVEDFPGEGVVEHFYRTEADATAGAPLPEILHRRNSEASAVRAGTVPAGVIERIRAEHGVAGFDMVLIDGSDFTGEAELDQVLGARLILLAGTTTFKGFRARQRLLADPNYELIADHPTLRGGVAAFRRSPSADDLPIHFFTIVLNGEPFIRYHEAMLAQLPFRWHWHVVEGVAALRHDTAWSTATGGRVTDDIHREGRSNDGTSEYLDDLARRFPGQVTIHRKPPGEFWDGKKEMVNAPLPAITEPCLLWQVDSDELWTVEQVSEMRRRFIAEPQRSAAFYWCWYFVGPDKIISTRHNYAQNPGQEWLRTWRFQPGDIWAAHEPPTLVRPLAEGAPPLDIAAMDPFTHDETEAAGAVFQHFAYATEAQLGFKESYYGYAGARARWHELLARRGSGFLADHFGWVTDRTMFDDAAVFGLVPLARQDGAGGWTFGAPQDASPPEPTRPRIVVDGVYWQYLSSGIGRVWQSLLEEWVADGSAEHVILLDRAGTAPRIAGVHYRTIAAHDYGASGADSLYLERICRELGADLFVSTYYSTPTETPSFFFGHDMIPEATGLDLTDEGWQEKARGIRHAAGHLMVSRHSAADLTRFFPDIAEQDIAVAHNGLAPAFRPASEVEVAKARGELDLPKRYALMVGDRSGAGGYKNGILAFRAAEQAAARGQRIAIICVGGLADIEPHFRAAAPSVAMRRVEADDATLRLLYAGAQALLYPSRYEGFGMPVLEAMACGCPVITCANSSLTEVGGEAAIYVDPDDPAAMAEALIALDDPAERAARAAAGAGQAARFTIRAQADATMAAFRATIDDIAAGRRARPGSGWREFRTYQSSIQAWAQDRPELAQGILTAQGASGRSGPARPSGALLRALAQIDAMKNSPFWRLRGWVIGALRKTGLRHRG